MIIMELARNGALFIFLLCICASILTMGIAGLLFAVAHGDSRKQSAANGCLIGAVVCILLGASAFFVPEAVHATVLRPLGVVPDIQFSGRSCDDTLRHQLVSNRQANTASRMNAVITAVQARYTECGRVHWDPEVSPGACSGTVGGITIPAGLDSTGRNNSNSILVGFKRAPTDRAGCWLYEGQLGVWVGDSG